MKTKKFTYKKTELLNTMKRILSEYKMNNHIANVTDCALCIVYNRDDDKNHKGHECKLCPMYVFLKGLDNWYPCMRRKCSPIDCGEDDSYSTEELEELHAVIKFYKEAINVVEGMTAEQLNEPKAFTFLIKIDKLIAKEFCLV